MRELASFLLVPSGHARVGSTVEELEAAVEYWSERIDVSPARLRAWFWKEVPIHLAWVDTILVQRVPVTRWLALRDQTRAEEPLIAPSAAAADELVAAIASSTGIAFRLLSEAEWEWVARADTRFEFPWGNDFSPTRCNTVEARIGSTCSVLRHAGGASPFGVLDLAGNVEEWTSTVYAPHPGGEPVLDDLASKSAGPYSVCKGGSFEAHGDLTRVARRHGWIPDHKAYGFRLAVTAAGMSPSQAEDAVEQWSSSVKPTRDPGPTSEKVEGR